MSLTTERLKRVCVVVSNVTNLCALINVADEQYFLQKCMSPESFEECMAGDTNITRVQILCEKMVKDIMAENMKLYDAICEYFLGRSETYKCMYQQFAVIGSSNSANGGSRSNAVQSELFTLQERVKELTEELQRLRESNATTDYQSELVAVRDIFTEKETANVVNTAMEVEKLVKEPAIVATHSLLRETKLSSRSNYNKPNVKEEIQTADDVSALTGDDKENDSDNDEVHNVSEAVDATNKTTNPNHRHQCEYCGKKFRKKGNFVNHVRIHTGEKLFGCKDCDKRFSQNGHLLRHCRTHTADRPHVCEHCGMAFRFKLEFRRHLLHNHSHANKKKRKSVHVASSSA